MPGGRGVRPPGTTAGNGAAGQPFGTTPTLSSATLVHFFPLTSLRARSRTYRAVVDGIVTVCSAAEFGNVPVATGLPQLLPSVER